MKRMVLLFFGCFFCMPILAMEYVVKKRRVCNKGAEMKEEFFQAQKRVRAKTYFLAEKQFIELAQQDVDAGIKVRACLALAKLYFFGYDGVKKKIKSMKAYLLKAEQEVEASNLPDEEVSLIEKLYKNYRNEKRLLPELGLSLEDPAFSLLSFAMKKNYVDMVDLLLVMHINAGMLNRQKAPSIMWEAVRLQRDEIVELLLSNGADPFLDTDEASNTILHSARTPTIVRALACYDELVIALNCRGETPLHVIARRCEADDVKEVLGALLQGRDDKAVLDARDYEGRTALHYAAVEGRVEVVKFLLAHGADVRIVDKNGMLAEDLVANKDLFNKIKMLLRGAWYAQAKDRGIVERAMSFIDVDHPDYLKRFWLIVGTGWTAAHFRFIDSNRIYQLVGFLLPSSVSPTDPIVWKAWIYGIAGINVLNSALSMYGGPTVGTQFCQVLINGDPGWWRAFWEGFCLDTK